MTFVVGMRKKGGGGARADKENQPPLSPKNEYFSENKIKEPAPTDYPNSGNDFPQPPVPPPPQ